MLLALLFLLLFVGIGLFVFSCLILYLIHKKQDKPEENEQKY
jgi:hypothetical protein